MRRERLTVLVGSLAGTVVGWGLFAALYPLWPDPSSLITTADRILFAIRANVPVALLIFIMTIAIGLARFVGGTFDPLAERSGRFIEVTARVLTNSVEQGVVFIVASLALAAVLPGPELRAVSGLAALFVFSRLVFWGGYLVDPLYRAAGMALTYQVNLAVLGFVIFRLLV